MSITVGFRPMAVNGLVFFASNTLRLTGRFVPIGAKYA